MVKEPRPGRVKTRLGRELGHIQAAWWFRHQTRRLIRRLSADPRWKTTLAVAPDVEGRTSRNWPAAIRRQPQGSGDLGDRMARILRSAPAGPALIVGADIPGILPHHIASAFAALGTRDAVFGPALDGGFWAIGVKNTRALHRSFLKDVRWSSEHALSDTLATLRGYSVAFVKELGDVDSFEDLKTTLSDEKRT